MNRQHALNSSHGSARTSIKSLGAVACGKLSGYCGPAHPGYLTVPLSRVPAYAHVRATYSIPGMLTCGSHPGRRCVAPPLDPMQKLAANFQGSQEVMCAKLVVLQNRCFQACSCSPEESHAASIQSQNAKCVKMQYIIDAMLLHSR